MKTTVTFRSRKFPPYEGEEERINPGLWGQRLAEYLAAELTGAGFETGPIVPEDWGWYVPLENRGFRLGVCCGHQQGEDDTFLCFTDPPAPTVRRWFRKIDATPQLERLVAALDRILSSDPEITEVGWSET